MKKITKQYKTYQKSENTITSRYFAGIKEGINWVVYRQEGNAEYDTHDNKPCKCDKRIQHNN